MLLECLCVCRCVCVCECIRACVTMSIITTDQIRDTMILLYKYKGRWVTEKEEILIIQ